MAPWVRTALGRTLVNNAAIFGGEAVSRLATLGMGVVVTRRFGPVTLGQYPHALALASLFLIIPDFGLHLLATQELTAESEQPGRIFWSLYWIKFFMVDGVALFAVLFGDEVLQDCRRRFLLHNLRRQAFGGVASGRLLKICLGTAALMLLLAALERAEMAWAGWSLASNLLLLIGTRIFVGLPNHQQLFLIPDGTS